ncbi:MAG: hypothetical protein P8Q95_01335 [Candidatus Poseidoniaceae archaeon]|nr:hypothetical protein [Candidatus Poseidoniaceae archaeon]
MSYVTVTGNIQMVDMACIQEALKKLNANQIAISTSSLSFSINQTRYQYRITKNNILTTVSNETHYQQSSNFMRTLESNYSQVLAEKQERIRLEKIRQEKLRREKLQLEQKLAAQSENISKEQHAADKASQNRLSKLNDELNSAQNSIAEAESFLAQVEQSKKEFVTKTVDEIVTRGQNTGWTVSHNKQEANRAVTRLQLRKKQTN